MIGWFADLKLMPKRMTRNKSVDHISRIWPIILYDKIPTETFFEHYRLANRFADRKKLCFLINILRWAICI